MKITFLGAAGEVTGSQHLIETDSLRLLLECGLFQGHRAECRAKNERFLCDPQGLDGVILSHAHIDHGGNLPGLFRAGFRGPVFCTHATADIARIMLIDSARIQSEDVRYLNRNRAPGEPEITPLYDEQHVNGVCQLFDPLPFAQWHELADDVRLRFSPAGHILGSAITELEIRERGEWCRIVFTGDLGRREKPLLNDPTPIDGCDVLITESTYGNRVHPPAADMQAELLRVIQRAAQAGGRVIIPAFSLGRTQTVVYFLNQLRNEGNLPDIPVFVDSPLANRLTSVYRDYQDTMDSDVQAAARTDTSVFDFPGLTYIRSQADSVALNRRRTPFVVIAASGMCENGRVVHHLRHALDDERNTVLIIGFQARHTLGRRIVEKRETVRIFGREVRLRADVEVINGLSAHADLPDFRWWFDRMARTGGIGQAFLVHGEPEASAALSEALIDHSDEIPIVPQFGESFKIGSRTGGTFETPGSG